MKTAIIIIIMVIAFAAGLSFNITNQTTRQKIEKNDEIKRDSYPREETYVTRVIDGDTIVVGGGLRVRLLGIDSRERGEDCYNEAKQFLQELIEGKNIEMQRIGENKDRYGRLLRYIFYNDTLINNLLVEEGLAFAYTYDEDEYTSQIAQTEREARTASIGCLWE